MESTFIKLFSNINQQVNVFYTKNTLNKRFNLKSNQHFMNRQAKINSNKPKKSNNTTYKFYKFDQPNFAIT